MPPAGGPVDERFAFLEFIMRSIANMMTTGEPELTRIAFAVLTSFAVISLAGMVLVKMFSAPDAPDLMSAVVRRLLLIMFAFTILNFWARPIPGIGYSFTGLISDTMWNFAMILDARSFERMLNQTDDLWRRVSIPNIWELGPFLMWILLMLAAQLLKAIIFYIVAGSLVKAAVLKLLGVLSVPFLLWPKMDFVFWGFLKSFLVASFTPVVAFAMLLIFQEFAYNFLSWLPADLPVSSYPLYIGTCLMMLVFMAMNLWSAPSIAASFFSGHVHDHGGGGFGALFKSAPKPPAPVIIQQVAAPPAPAAAQ